MTVLNNVSVIEVFVTLVQIRDTKEIAAISSFDGFETNAEKYNILDQQVARCAFSATPTEVIDAEVIDSETNGGPANKPAASNPSPRSRAARKPKSGAKTRRVAGARSKA